MKDEKGCTGVPVEIAGSVSDFPFDFSMGSVFAFAKRKAWTHSYLDLLERLSLAKGSMTDIVEYLKLAHDLAGAKHKLGTKLTDIDIANNYLTIVKAMDGEFAADLTTQGGLQEESAEKK